MQISYLMIIWLCIILPYIINSSNKKKLVMYKNIIMKKKLAKNGMDNKTGEDDRIMREAAKQFIDKECIITVFGSDMQGVIKEITEDGAMLVQNGRENIAVNLDFVMKIKEIPLNKKGKKSWIY